MKKILLWVAGIVVGLFALMMVVGSASDPTGEKGKRRRAIELCWEGQGRKSLAPGEQRFIAGACEQMEQEFTQQFGVKP